MARIDWRPIIGPTITLALGGAILLMDRHLFRVPNPGAILFLAVAFSAYVGGIPSGLASAAISIGFAAVHVLGPADRITSPRRIWRASWSWQYARPPPRS